VLISGLFPLLIILYVFLYHLKRPTTYKIKTCSVPQAGGAWPIIGHLHLLGGRQLTHRTLGTMADKYGPIFTIMLGSHRVLVLSCWEMAKECFTVHDKVSSTRPSTFASRLLVEVAVQPLKENDKQLRRSGSKAHVVYLHR
jgi:hypothetical protein